MYDKAEALFFAFDKREAEILTRHEPKLAKFYVVFTPFLDAERKMRRYEFLKQIKDNPKSIDWPSFWNWAGVRNLGTLEQEKLAAEDPAYRALREDFLTKKETLRQAKDLTKMRNKVYEKHKDEFVPLEEDLLKDLKGLQSEVDKRISNKPVDQSR